MDELYNNINKNIKKTSSEPSSKKNFKLKKQTRTVTLYSKPITSQTKLTKEDINKIKKQTLGDELIKFRKKLYKIFKSENLNLLNNNIKPLKIKIKYIAPEMLLLKFSSGKYLFKKNKIEIIKYFKEETSNHEFFHLASTFYFKEGKLCFSGFLQINYLKKEIIGQGLNEGYTELLTDRYFNKQRNIRSYSYDICTFFAEKLEQIIEKDRMEKFYINADLLGLCKYLKNFDDLENIICFLLNLDYLIRHSSPITPKKSERYYKSVECYLAKWYINKKKQELEKNIIDENTYKLKIKNYIDSLENKDLHIENFLKQKEYCLK